MSSIFAKATYHKDQGHSDDSEARQLLDYYPHSPALVLPSEDRALVQMLSVILQVFCVQKQTFVGR